MPEKVDRWLFSEESLKRTRGVIHERSFKALHSMRESPRPLSLDQSLCLAEFQLQRIPELCRLCSAPSDVQWTAVVFYQRFFTVRSPMEFDPLPMMFACVHLACKVEEFHEITLDSLFEVASRFGANEAVKSKVVLLELHLLEGIGFQLLVEPKPDTALHGLVDDLQRMPAWSGVARGLDLHPANMENTWNEIITAAEKLMIHLSISTDAILLIPPMVIAAAALGSVLARHSSLGSDGGQAVEILQALLEARHQQKSEWDESGKVGIRSMFHRALQDVERLVTSDEIVVDDSLKETAQRCHRAFERLRVEATERHEANRQERKRRFKEVERDKRDSIRRQVPTPFMQEFNRISRRGGSLLQMIEGNHTDSFVMQGLSRPDVDMSRPDDDEFVIHSRHLD